MAEYIKREAAIHAIMKVYVRTAGYKARERVFEAKEAVHRLPAADVAPVVRCKDCKHFREYTTGGTVCIKDVKLLGGHEVGIRATEKDDFCSYGGKAKW